MNFALNCLHRVNAILKSVLAPLCAVILAALTAVVLWGVATRYLLGNQAKFTDEAARMLLIILTFFGAALAFAQNSHIGLDFLISKFAPCAKKSAEVLGILISIFFALCVLGSGGVLLVVTSYHSGNCLVSAPIAMWVVYLCVPLSGILSAMFLTEQLILKIRENNAGKDEQ